MDPTAGFLVYATLYRLAIVAVGTVAIVLGYRLFLRATASGRAGDTSASAEAGGFKLSISNAAPGTCFALFGAAVIAAMIVQGNPELMTGGAETGAAVRMKGATGSVPAITGARAGPDLGDGAEALVAYGRALASPDVTVAEVAAAASGIAGIYLRQGRAKEALALARLAVQLDSRHSEYLQTLAVVAAANGEHAEAAAAAQRAAAPAAGARPGP